MGHTNRGWVVTFAMLLAAVATNAFPQTFPSRPITVVMPIPATTAFYVMMRQMADEIQAKTGKSIVLDPTIGADGTLAPARVRRTEADGHTIGLTWDGPLTINPSLPTGTDYDPLRDFDYITLLTRLGTFFAASPQAPFNTIQELVAYAKARPGAVKFGRASTNPRLFMLQLEEAAGVKFLDVPYKSNVQTAPAVMVGEVDIISTTAGSVVAHVQAGKMKGLFIGSRERSPLHPNTQSISEVYPNLEFSSWYGLYAKRGTPADAIAWHHREWTAALKNPKIAERMEKTFGYIVVAGSPQQMADQVRRELPLYKQLLTKYPMSE
jgi:tripartite-type tricarboxylate transporter receptor subunit TctC